MSNRQERRNAARQQINRSQQLLASYNKAERIDRLMQQGISPEDLKKAYNDGFADGYRKAAVPTIEACYAAVCVALHEQFGFGQDRCIRVVSAVDEQIVTMITSEEIRQQALEKAGVDIRFEDGVDRIGPTEKKRGTDK